jgi:hypothetical protein
MLTAPWRRTSTFVSLACRFRNENPPSRPFPFREARDVDPFRSVRQAHDPRRIRPRRASAHGPGGEPGCPAHRCLVHACGPGGGRAASAPRLARAHGLHRLHTGGIPSHARRRGGDGLRLQAPPLPRPARSPGAQHAVARAVDRLLRSPGVGALGPVVPVIGRVGPRHTRRTAAHEYPPCRRVRPARDARHLAGALARGGCGVAARDRGGQRSPGRRAGACARLAVAARVGLAGDSAAHPQNRG